MFTRLQFVSLAVVGALFANDVAAQKGPNGGQLVDAADRFHLELVVAGQELRLFVADLKDKPVSTQGASARATVVSSGGKTVVELKPGSANSLVGSGPFGRSKSMKVDVSLSLPGAAPVTAKFTPLSDAPGGSHAGHKH